MQFRSEGVRERREGGKEGGRERGKEGGREGGKERVRESERGRGREGRFTCVCQVWSHGGVMMMRKRRSDKGVRERQSRNGTCHAPHETMPTTCHAP